MKSYVIFFIVALVPFLNSCSVQEEKMNHQLSILMIQMDNDRWSEVKPLLTSRFKFINMNSGTYTGTKGIKALQYSVRLKGRIILEHEVISAEMMDDGTFYVVILMKADTYRTATSITKHEWRVAHSWKKQDGLWKLDSVKTLSKRTKKPSNTAPPAGSAPERFLDDIKSARDYGTGATPLKVKKKTKRITDKLSKFNKERSQLDDEDEE